jgi:hypothetical protein
MNLNGDVPEKDRNLALKLIEYERLVDDMTDFPDEKRAQSYVCLAHDWYQIGMEEEGGRLLLKADSTFPGYFKTTMVKHIAESEDFDRLVKSFTVQLITMIMGQK